MPAVAEREAASERGEDVVVPKWFLGFLSATVTLLAVAVVPWAVSVADSLTTLSVEMAALRARFDGRDALREEMFRGLSQRVDRLELALDRLGQERGLAETPHR